MGIVPSKRRWERKMRARDRSVKFQGHAANNNVDKVSQCADTYTFKICHSKIYESMTDTITSIEYCSNQRLIGKREISHFRENSRS